MINPGMMMKLMNAKNTFESNHPKFAAFVSRFFMGKHYAIEFQLQVLQPILKGKMGIREAARFYHIPSGTLETF